jgi:aspartate/methionine/tyrosine aminotransferase
MFSSLASRLHGEKNPLYRLRDQLHSEGVVPTDLVSGNVHEHGIRFPQIVLETILIRASRRCMDYHPDSFGREDARRAISAYYAAQDVSIPPDRLLLTPGTSIAYWYCFKLLANEGEEILCPSPSYPLFEYIAELSGVRMIPYRLDERCAWAIDIDHLESVASTATRALVLISPHNPTGHVSSAEEIAALAEIARRHDLAIISDEVFSEFLISAQRLPRPAASAAPLILTLNGFSKMFALPGFKLGWMGVSGDADRVAEALRALELISDTFLPVNEIVQAAVADVFREGAAFVEDFAGQVRRRWQVAEGVLRQCAHASFVPPAGGFYVTLRLEGLEEEAAALAALRGEHLLVHPGYFYDIQPHHLVLSFIQHPNTIRDALPRLVRGLR